MLGRPPNLPRRERQSAQIDLADIQGNVLRGYTMPAAAYLFLRIVNVDAARRLMTRMLPKVATAEPWSERPVAAMNVAFFADDKAKLQAALAAVIGSDAEEDAVSLVHLQQAENLTGGLDHFGFFDGIAQPAVAGTGVSPRPGDGQPDGAGGWRELATGEVLLGHEDEDGTLPAAPLAPFDRNGTFVVYRKLHTDTAAFRRLVRDAGYP